MIAYTPFVSPLPVWDYWPVLLIPLCVAIAVVYKAIRCESMTQVPWQSFVITLWILGGIAAAAVVLSVIVRFT